MKITNFQLHRNKHFHHYFNKLTKSNRKFNNITKLKKSSLIGFNFKKNSLGIFSLHFTAERPLESGGNHGCLILHQSMSSLSIFQHNSHKILPFYKETRNHRFRSISQAKSRL